MPAPAGPAGILRNTDRSGIFLFTIPGCPPVRSASFPQNHYFRLGFGLVILTAPPKRGQISYRNNLSRFRQFHVPSSQLPVSSFHRCNFPPLLAFTLFQLYCPFSKRGRARGKREAFKKRRARMGDYDKRASH